MNTEIINIAILILLILIFPVILFRKKEKSKSLPTIPPINLEPINERIISLVDAQQYVLQRIEETDNKIGYSNNSLSNEIIKLSENIKYITENIGDLEQKISHSNTESSNISTRQKNIIQEIQGIDSRLEELKQISNSLSQIYQKTNMLDTKEGKTSQDVARLQNIVQNIKEELSTLKTYAGEQHSLYNETTGTIKRLEQLITRRKGGAGESLIDDMLSSFPHDWVVRNYKVNGKHVEFGLKLPDRKILPIDSKWTSLADVEEYQNCSDDVKRKRLAKKIQDTVLTRADEIKKYIDPTKTTAFGIAVVPDTVYDICSKVHGEILERNIALVSYSLLVPYLLLTFQVVLANDKNIDIQQLEQGVRVIGNSISTIQKEIDSRFSRVITMLENSRTDIKRTLNDAGSGLHLLKGNSSATIEYDKNDLITMDDN